MDQEIDPYRIWLGINDPQRPPNHYRLLSLDLFESHPDVISNAADRQMAHVRSFASGPQGKLSQQVLNELSAARVCLLSPDKKAAYDAQLKAETAARKRAAQPAAAKRPSDLTVAQPLQEPFADFARETPGYKRPPAPGSTRKRSQRPNSAPLVIGSVAAAVVVMVLIAVGMSSRRTEKVTQKPTPPTSDVGSAGSSPSPAEEKPVEKPSPPQPEPVQPAEPVQHVEPAEPPPKRAEVELAGKQEHHDPETPARDAHVFGGNWSIDGDELVQSSAEAAIAGLYFGDRSWSDYDYEFQVKVIEGAKGFIYVSFNGASLDSFRVLRLGTFGQAAQDINHFFPGRSTTRAGGNGVNSIQPGEWHDVRIEVRGPKCRCLLDEKSVIEETDDRYGAGCVGLGCFGTSARFRNLLVKSSDGTVRWEGMPRLPEGRVILNPRDWAFSQPALVAMGPDDLVVTAGPTGNYVMTARANYKHVRLAIDMSAEKGTEAWLLICCEQNNGSWFGRTARIFDGGDAIRVGKQSLSFSLDERGMHHAQIGYGKFFHVDLTAIDDNVWIKIGDDLTSGVQWNSPTGSIGVFVKRGSVSIRRFEIDAERVDIVAPAEGLAVAENDVERSLVATSEREPQIWRYTIKQPPSGWEVADFDVSTWNQGPAGFGSKGTTESHVNTEWTTDRIWLRREFDLDQFEPAGAYLRIHHDEDADVYINGVLAANAPAWTDRYGLIPISNQARAALKQGRNVLAVHCKQTGGGQYIDVGLVEIVAPADKSPPAQAPASHPEAAVAEESRIKVEPAEAPKSPNDVPVAGAPMPAGEEAEKAPGPNPIADELNAAKADFKAAVEEATGNLLAAFDEQKKKLAARATAKVEERIRLSNELDAQKSAFETDGILPKSSLLKAAARDYQARIDKARKKFQKALDEAAQAYGRKGDLATAGVVLLERETLFGLVPGKQNRFPPIQSQDGEWTLDPPLLVQSSSKPGFAFLGFGDPAWERYDLTLKAKASEGLDGFLILFHVKDFKNFRDFSVGGYKNTYHDLACMLNGGWNLEHREGRAGTIEREKWYDVRIEVRGSEAVAKLNGEVICKNIDDRLTAGRIGLCTSSTKVCFRDIIVTSEDGKAVLWQGNPQPK